MKIRKAVITAASQSQRDLPLQTVVDRDGVQKSALKVIVEEALSAGVEEIAIIIYPGDAHTFLAAISNYAARLQFIEQPSQRGYGFAVYCARDFTGSEPFLHLVSDHLYISSVHAGNQSKTCAQQLIEVAEAQSCSISAVQSTRENMLPYYGIVGGRRVAGSSALYTVENVIEKPTPTEAEQQLIVPGVRAGYYLSFFGQHVLTPGIMAILTDQVQASDDGAKLQLSPALAQLAARERYLAYEVQGRRYDIGVHYGMLIAQLALALSGRERDDVLAQLVELLASREMARIEA